MITFAYPHLLFLLLLVPLVALLYVASRYARKRNLKKFGNIRTLKGLMPLISPYKPPLQLTMELLALACIVIALARPWGGVKDEKSEKEGIEVILAVDASNSMLAPVGDSENGPDRMRTAKLILEKIINRLDNDRVGLIVYAGGAYTLIPVTSDYVSAKMFLNSIDPGQISNQGTNIAEAVNLAANSFTDDKNIGKAVILITDAEELEDSEGVMQAVRNAAKNKIQIDVVGVGGSSPVRIPMNGGYVTDPDSGDAVMTTLNEDLATEIAKQGKGIYVNASNSGAVNELDKQLNTVKKTSLETNAYVVHDELFYIFVIFAILFIVARLMILDRKILWLDRISFFNKTTAVIVGVISVAAFSSVSVSAENKKAESTRQERKLISEGNKIFSEGDFLKAAGLYQKALKENPQSAVALYNLALTKLNRGYAAQSDSLKNTLLKSANEDFSKVGQLGGQKPDLSAKAFYNMGNMAFKADDYKNAIENYKQSLRLNPADNKARRNLRIAQLKQQEQNKNQDQNKDQKKDQDKQQDNDKDKDKNQDQNKDQNREQDKKEDQKQPDAINQQTADRILKAMENKENATRARVQGNGDKSSGVPASRKRW